MVPRSSVLTGFYCTEKLDSLKRDSRNECVFQIYTRRTMSPYLITLVDTTGKRRSNKQKKKDPV